MKMNDKLCYVQSKIVDVHNFPKQGVVFKDIMGILMCPTAFDYSIDIMTDHLTENFIKKGQKIDIICGLEARGFLFGPSIASRLKCSFCPIRKAGKLPGKCISGEYELEYGKDKVEIQEGSIKPGQNVVIIDDLLATGGTMQMACSLVKKVGGNILDCLLLIELASLNGRKKITDPCTCLLVYHDS